LRQQIRTGPNPWLWAWATHLAKTGRRARLEQPLSAPTRISSVWSS